MRALLQEEKAKEDEWKQKVAKAEGVEKEALQKEFDKFKAESSDRIKQARNS